jgi:hypothetical protein
MRLLGRGAGRRARRTMSVNAGLAKLKRGAKDLRAQWGEVRSTWHDENAWRFEQNHLAPLLTRLRTVELTMGHMITVLRKAHHDCE